MDKPRHTPGGPAPSPSLCGQMAAIAIFMFGVGLAVGGTIGVHQGHQKAYREAVAAGAATWETHVETGEKQIMFINRDRPEIKHD